MVILVLGNGFDIAHGLKTKYADFLKVANQYQEYSNGGITPTVPLPAEEIEDEFVEMVKDNAWILYFSRCYQRIGSGWIDFEAEISRVIQSLDTDRYSPGSSEDYIETLSDEDALTVFVEYLKIGLFCMLYDRLKIDLYKLIRAYEIYLSVYVNNEDTLIRIPEVSDLQPDRVLTFNYTNTYERLYNNTNTQKGSICHVHGFAEIENKFENMSTNMVLGIDEYLKGDAKNRNLQHIEFKKYYQRIIKCTGNDYRRWIDIIRDLRELTDLDRVKLERLMGTLCTVDICKNTRGMHKLIVYGHSLGQTDGDILRELICNDNVQTTIYYHNREAFTEIVKNLIQILGQDELIKRTGGKSKTIWFKQQQSAKKLDVDS